LHALDIETIFQTDWQTVERTNWLPVFLKVDIAFTGAREGLIEHDFRETRDTLLGNGCAFAKGGYDIDALELACAH
jgi:hypothetical protein